MAEAGPSYGLTKECELKTQSKFDLDRAIEAMNWVMALTDHPITPPEGGWTDQTQFQQVLKDGVALCKAMNALQPNSIAKINQSAMVFKQRENIELFLKAAVQYGVPAHNTFQVESLYEGKSLYTVIDCLFALGAVAQKNRFDGPRLGIKYAEENPRQFTAEQLQAGRAVISLQYGSNKGASQAGMTAPGTSRHM